MAKPKGQPDAEVRALPDVREVSEPKAEPKGLPEVEEWELPDVGKQEQQPGVGKRE